MTRAQRGFTLIEVLLATVLLAAGLALAFATLRAANGTTRRGEAMAEQGEHMRAVEGFLRRRIAAAAPMTLPDDRVAASDAPMEEAPRRFTGDARHMRFIADLPAYLGYGGPYLHELQVDEDRKGLRLTVQLTLMHGGVRVVEDPPRAPEVLATGMRDVRFRYRAMTEDNHLGDWQDEWLQVERMPVQVQVLLRDGEGRTWPPLVVALPLASMATAEMVLR